MGIYENLEKFTLISHGDGREQQWADHVLPEFPAYQVFWRRYIVPLTNRVDPQVSRSQNPQLWIGVRPDVRDVHEQMAMHHYSIFYYLARATQRIRSDKAEFPEDIFSLLDACGDNVKAFFSDLRLILKDFGKTADFLPSQKNEFCSDQDRFKEPNARGAFVEVQSYRDTILHNPVLSRVASQSAVWLPRAAFLDKVKLSWKNAACLKPEDWINSKALYSRLHLDVTSFLEVKWGRLIDLLDGLRDADKFKLQWALDERFLPIPIPQETGSSSQSLIVSSSSGEPGISYSPTASVIRVFRPPET
jgi:hypothetical protein